MVDDCSESSFDNRTLTVAASRLRNSLLPDIRQPDLFYVSLGDNLVHYTLYITVYKIYRESEKLFWNI